MKVSKGTFVALNYELRLGSKNGELVEQTRENQPEKFVIGKGKMLDIFENELIGLKENQSFNIEISPQEAFGEYDNDAIIEFTEEEFQELVGETDGDFELGAYFPMEDDEGNHYDGFITEMDDDRVVIDFNHPLAGEKLFFSGKIEEVRKAEPKDLEE